MLEDGPLLLWSALHKPLSGLRIRAEHHFLSWIWLVPDISDKNCIRDGSLLSWAGHPGVNTIPCHLLRLWLVNDWNGDLLLVNDKNGGIWLANSISLGHKECLEMKVKEGLWLCMFICKVRRGATNHTSPDHGHQTVTRTQPPVYNPCFTIPNGLLQILQSVSKQRYSRITAECLGF